MPDKKVVVFVGPSLRHKEAQIILEVDYRPPAERGDIKKASQQNPHTICLIDGVFSQDCSVSHREILQTLQKNINVVGASSMGALRASELDRYGMKGIGEIYSRYKQGTINSDDEVALTFSPQNYQPLSTPLINIRYNLEQATQKNIITQQEMEKLIQETKKKFYPKRNYSLLLKIARKHPRINHSELKQFLEENKVDLKKEDAKKALKYIKNHYKN
ncbi:TfuA-related McrA-glycine thioamidation protein [Methanonatronarchaeum sp. AMET6-2]|uniref:TfuA-related McrA-glycine thioamidation protein n=1 Tax=Methanonatronarchaeum sp. AMET6-2 TaxID=2933293 RepID=UPI001FF58AEA|nr:TfuA-related McrA-glycine thioamidation protein [Methanonatronarchaeum sp. AMET6-2]UOY10306.1 TfuA-related McrA-glycine thioamidation protein [Methanonatronarchaeum sp. AMET6-2]